MKKLFVLALIAVSFNASASLLECSNGETRIMSLEIKEKDIGCVGNGNLTAVVDGSEYCVANQTGGRLTVGSYQACVVFEEQQITVIDAVDSRNK